MTAITFILNVLFARPCGVDAVRAVILDGGQSQADTALVAFDSAGQVCA
jgi:hypothetical protein